MPCRSDYMEPNAQEIELSKVLALLEELRTKELPSYYGDGSYPSAYENTRILDSRTAELCEALRQIERTQLERIEDYSPEMQMWWGDHKKLDKRREEAERNAMAKQMNIYAALDKLTPTEIELLIEYFRYGTDE